MSYYKNSKIPQTEIINNNLEIDWDLFRKVLSFRSYSSSKEQIKFRDWLHEWVLDNVKDVDISFDNYGNMYVVKGESDLYPCIVAHLDINQDKIEDFAIIKTDRYVFGFDNKTGKQCGLGFDDKNGVYFAMMMLQKLDVVKCFFPLDEEIGCKGTKNADMSFFEDCSLLIQLDRNSYNNDISYCTNGVTVVSDEFKKAAKFLLKEYSYSFEYCIYTDIGELVKQNCGCVAMNISCGYFNEHNDDEIMSINHYINAINFSCDIIMKLGYKKRWCHKAEAESYKYSYRGWDWDYDYDVNFKNEDKNDDVYFYYHHSEHFQFTDCDEEYIQECIGCNQCPVCNSGVHEIEEEEMVAVCSSCESVFYIPEDKSAQEILDLYYMNNPATRKKDDFII